MNIINAYQTSIRRLYPTDLTTNVMETFSIRLRGKNISADKNFFHSSLLFLQYLFIYQHRIVGKKRC
jgi:hypothetical protein